MSGRPDPLAVLRADRGECYADYQQRQQALADVAALVEAARQVSKSKLESPRALIDSLGALDAALAPFGDKP